MSDPLTPLHAQWMALVDKTLKGAPFDKKLVFRFRDGFSQMALGLAPPSMPQGLPVRPDPALDPERPWILLSRIDQPLASLARDLALKELNEGAAGILLSLDPSAKTGLCLGDHQDMARAVEGIYLDLAPVRLDAGLLGPQAADALAVAAKGAPSALLSFHLDPISALAEQGTLSGPIEGHLRLAAQTAHRHAAAYPKAKLFLASARYVHEMGGTSAQELSALCASLVLYVDTLIEAGLSTREAFLRTPLSLSVDADYFESLSKLRAARWLHAKIALAYGVQDVPAIIEARSSRRMLSKLDPWTNLLRLTAAGFAAGVGGAEALCLDPFTAPLGEADDFSRRQARNIQLVLMEEASLGRVTDPAAGSFWLEDLTQALARTAWGGFQDIMAQGGLISVLKSGALHEKVRVEAEKRAKDLRHRRPGLIGVSEFPDLNTVAPSLGTLSRSPLRSALSPSRPDGDDTCITAFIPRSDGADFEALRDKIPATDRALAFILTLGTASDYTARAMFAGNWLGLAGLKARQGTFAAYQGEPIVVVSGSDSLYETDLLDALEQFTALPNAKDALIVLAGRLEALTEPLRHALLKHGVRTCVFAGGDVITALDPVLSQLTGSGESFAPLRADKSPLQEIPHDR